jgi:hypothetical protein
MTDLKTSWNTGKGPRVDDKKLLENLAVSQFEIVEKFAAACCPANQTSA